MKKKRKRRREGYGKGGKEKETIETTRALIYANCAYTCDYTGYFRRYHFRVTRTLWTRSRFSFASLIFDAYLRKKLTEFTFAVGETRVDDEMIPTVLEL